MSWKGGWNKPGIKPIVPNKPASGTLGAAKAAPAVNKPAAGTGIAKKPPALNGKTPVFTVSTKSKSDEIGIMTLVGDYCEVGSNHTKKYYQKIQDIPGHKDVKVFLYYWDNRDGPDFSGWWFGDQLGGSQVWARCSSHGQTPPKLGWKIPWDAPKPEPGILTVEPYQAGKPSTPSATPPKVSTPAKPAVSTPAKPLSASSSAVSPAQLAERVKEATANVEAAETEAKEVLQKAKGMSGANDEAELKELQSELEAQQSALTEAQKSLTQDINESRKGGPTAVTSVTALSKLSPRLRTLTTNIVTEIGKVKGYITKAATDKKSAAELKGKESAHAAELQKALPAVKETVNSAEDCVEAVVIMASPLVNDPPEELGEATMRSMDEVESAATDAQEKIMEARKVVNAKTQASRAYAPEARKTALAEYTGLQEKLTEAQKKLNPYKNFKKDFSQRAEAKKALADLVEKLAEAELEVEKAAMMSAAADQGQMSEDEVKSSEELTKPALAACNKISSLIEAKMKGASGPMRDELTQMKSRLLDTRKKLDGVSTVVKRQREGLVLQKMAGEVTEKVDAAEESLVQCQEAEMPFLKGIEVLPAEESSKAITESEKAAAASSKVIEQAKLFIRQKLTEIKKYDKDAAKLVTEEVNELQQRLEEVAKKLSSFKTDTTDRKMAAIMSEVLDAVTTAERKGKELTEATAIFATEVLDDVSSEELKAAAEKATALDKEVTAALSEARKSVAAKQKDAKTGDLAQSLSKINARLSVVNQEQTKAKKATATADRLVKGKALLSEEEVKVKQGEEEVVKAEDAAKVEEGETLTDENIKEIDRAMTSALKVLKASQIALQPHLASALPTVKAPMQKLLDRCKAGIVKLDEVKKDTKERREVVMSEVYVKEGKGMADAVEAALNKVSDAELPFLMGTENLELQEATSAIKASEEAGAEVLTAINAARSFLAAKNIEVKGFKADNAKAALEEFAKLTERINGEANKLSQFRKDTELRKKATQVQEASEKVTALEALVEKVAEASKPFAQEQTEEDLTGKWKELSELEKDAKSKADQLRGLLSKVQQDAKGNADKTKAHSEMNSRLQGALQELAKARKLVAAQETKFKAKAVLEEANTMVKDMEEEMKKATTHCAPLLEEGGERFLVGSRIGVIAEVLKEHMAEKDLTEEALLTEVNGGQAGNVAREPFIAYLARLPEAFGREELGLSEERQAAVFEQIDVDKDGEISVADLREAMKKKYICVQGVAVSEAFDMASKTVTKLEAGDAIESFTAAKKESSDGVARLLCKVLDKEKEGWVTMKGNSGTVFLKEVPEFETWFKSVEEKLTETQQFNAKVSGFLNQKTKELGAAGLTGPLAEAKSELHKIRASVTKAQMGVDELRKKMLTAKKSHAAKEVKEANAHIEAAEQREANAILEVARAACTLMEDELKKMEETVGPLVNLSGDDLLAYPTPLTIQEDLKPMMESVKKNAEETKTIAKEQQDKLPKALKGPMQEARKETGTMIGKASKAIGAANAAQLAVKKAIETIGEAFLKRASVAVRDDMRKNTITTDDLWTKLSTGGDSISEEEFSKYLVSIWQEALSMEQAKITAQKLEPGGIGQRSFQSFVQLYFTVVKEIAITSGFELDTKEKPVRKAEVGENFEVLEGPTKDEKIGLERVRIKSLVDGVEGWVSVRGNNQGKVFLEEAQKPFYSCVKDLLLEPSFTSGGTALRTVKADEVLELMEGPRKESLKPAHRVRGKATSDGKMGWFTVKDTSGTALAVKGGNLWICTATVAMTDEFDIKSCKVVKKLAVDEIMTLMEDPKEDESSKITRMKGKSTKDGTEGWVTIKGNAGSVYAKVHDKLWSIVADEVPLHNQYISKGAKVHRVLLKDEAVEGLEGPKEEKVPPATRVKCRASGDGAVGWVTFEPESLKNFLGSYKVLKPAPMQSSRSAEMAAELGESALVRETVLGELLELVEGPMEDSEEMRAKCRAKKDGAIGWVSFKDKEGKKLLSFVL